MNEKGEMNYEEFERYINNTITPLFPDMEDTPGKRVFLKVDSGPGHNCMSLLVFADSRPIPLPRAAQGYLRAAGDRPQLRSLQESGL
jgi:hypothetical protein